MASSLPVENLLNEFYHPSTQNHRKHVIETELMSFKSQPNSWQQCLGGLSNFNNQFVWFFCTSTLEYTITRRWAHLRPTDRNHIRETLWTTYIKLPFDTPKRQRDTIAQLIALLGKREFPDDHPNYVTHMLELLSNNFQLGIVLLRTTSEEVVSAKEDVSTDRKKYFHSCISSCMTDIFEYIGKFLAISVCHLNGTDLNLIPDNLRDYKLNSALPNDSRINSSIIELLTCIQHLLSWVALDNLISDHFLMSICDLARWREQQHEISANSVSVLNELFYLQRAIPYPKTVMTGIKGLLEQCEINKSNEMYQDKFTELLRLFTAKFWTKVIHEDEDFSNFLYNLYQYTFGGYGALAFTERLGIWTPLIKALSPSGFGRYTDVMHLLVSGVLKKIQYRFDQEQELDMLDNETLDYNMETEWQHYLTQSVEVIAMVAEGRPFPVFEQVFGEWQRPFEMFISLEKAIDGQSLDISDQSKCHFIHCILRDVSSLCQTLTRLAPILECSPADKYPENLLQMTQCLLHSIQFLSCNNQCLNINNQMLRNDFAEIFAQILQAVRSLLHWSPILKSENELKQLIKNVGQILSPAAHVESKIICLAAAQLLLGITTIIRPKFMLEIDSIIQLVQGGPNLSYLSKQVITIIYEMLISCFVLPWQGIPSHEQDFDNRSMMLQEYMACLTRKLFTLDNLISNRATEIKAIVSDILPILKEVLDYFKESSSAVKNILTNAFKPIISESLSIFNSCSSYGHDVDVIISEFSLSALRSLQLQLGISFVKDMLTFFIDWSTSEQLTPRRMVAMEKILQMLLLVVEQPGNSTMSLIPSILSLALERILPLHIDVYQSDLFKRTDVAFLLYSLFDGVLHHRWQYFYKSQVQRGFSPGASDFATPTDDDPQHPEQLLAIFTSYGHALVDGNDPQITRTVLVSLQRLNDRWKLYNRDFFKTNLLPSFLCALINRLLSLEGALHFDLLLNVLFTMGQVNISKLHECFISVGCLPLNKNIEEICLTTDLPTFSHKMNQFIQDMRYIHIAPQY